MEQGVLTGIGGDAVSYPPPDFWAPAHKSLQSRGTEDDVRLSRPLHLPPIPPGSRRVPFKCPGAGAGAGAAAGAAAAAAAEPTAVPTRHSDCPITEAPAHIKGAGRPRPRLPPPPETPGAPAKGCGLSHPPPPGLRFLRFAEVHLHLLPIPLSGPKPSGAASRPGSRDPFPRL
ncbi:myc-associated zinc finger protein-like [Trachypithecus francoisi]|uniref:myc-associated zinc finger protein-like n=1 Tax=Trachypithecus francoisi TaxID=54180 RepID=UPI00141A74C9|nr:myc-associated zinc finger protein-like [Trachypithecus francoisi]